MSLCILYLASPRGNESGKRLSALQTSINITKKVFPTTDILVFHEDLIDTDLPEYVKLIQIDFSGYEKYHTYNHRYGYLMMCRFFSGILQNHSAIQNYTHYMRLDDDSFFIEPCENIDINEFMKYDYVYRSTFIENGHPQTELYKFTESFLHSKKLHMTSFNKQLAPYNNFHVASLRLWKHPLVKEFLDEIENNQLILKKGFLDANIHAYIIWGLLPLTDLTVKPINTFGYRHNYHVALVGEFEIKYLRHIPFSPSHSNIETLHELKVYKTNLFGFVK